MEVVGGVSLRPAQLRHLTPGEAGAGCFLPRRLQLPKIEDDGNPRFVIFIRTANVYFWYPLNVVTGGTTAKIMLAAKDNFLGKYIYKDTLARNLATVICWDTSSKFTEDFFRLVK